MKKIRSNVTVVVVKTLRIFDSSGPFGHAVRSNKGYNFGELPGSEFDRSPQDMHDQRPFTLIAWGKFAGKRHLAVGIWDEGGWDKCGGRRLRNMICTPRQTIARREFIEDIGGMKNACAAVEMLSQLRDAA